MVFLIIGGGECAFRQMLFGVSLGYVLAESRVRATPAGCVPNPFETVGEVSQALVPTIPHPDKSADEIMQMRHARRSYLSEYAHHDTQRALDRVLRVAKADRMLFVSRVLCYDSPMGDDKRYFAKVEKATQENPNANRLTAHLSKVRDTGVSGALQSAGIGVGGSRVSSSSRGEVVGGGVRPPQATRNPTNLGEVVRGGGHAPRAALKPAGASATKSSADNVAVKRSANSRPAGRAAKKPKTNVKAPPRTARTKRSRSASPSEGETSTSSSTKSSSDSDCGSVTSLSSTDSVVPTAPPLNTTSLADLANSANWQKFIPNAPAAPQSCGEKLLVFDDALQSSAVNFFKRPVKTLQTPRGAVLAARNLKQRLGIPTKFVVPTTFRRRVLENAADVFHTNALLRKGVVTNILTATEKGRAHCLKQLFEDLGQYVFKHDRACDIDDPPPEMFQRVSSDELLRQYKRLQDVAGRMAADRENLRLVGCEVSFHNHPPIIAPLEGLRAAGGTASSVRDLQEAARGLVEGRSRCEAQLIGHLVCLRRHKEYGVGQIRKVVYDLPDMAVYEMLMQCPYELVHLHGIWHILWLYHHCCMRGICTQTFCEGANSALRMLERRNSIGRPLCLQRLVEGTRLRCVGVRGDNSDLALIWRALRRHFSGRRKSTVRFFTQQQRRRIVLLADTEASSKAIATCRKKSLVSHSCKQSFLRSIATPPTSQQRLLDRDVVSCTDWEERFKPEVWTWVQSCLAASK